jgi:cytochrome c-type biogenesis protein CcmF
MDVRRGDQSFTLRPSRNFYSTTDPSKGAISRFFEGEATSEVDVQWSLRRDVWLAVRPDLVSLAEPIARADREFSQSPGDVQALVIGTIAQLYRQDPPPAAFRAIVSPLVSWIWIGGAIALLGALVAAWPTPEARLRRVRAIYSARLGKELSRA